MQLPIVAPVPVVQKHSEAFHNLFENQRQFRNFQNYLTALITLENKSLANISRCTLESADKTNLSRFLSQSPWQEEAVNERRIGYMLEQTVGHRDKPKRSCLIVDDTLCEHVGSLFEYVDRHYDHCESRFPLAHNLVTSYFLSGPVRFPLDVRLYRRFEEVTQWERFVGKHFPERAIPKKAKERTRFHEKVDPLLLQDPEFAALAAQFQTKITLAMVLMEKAIARGVPFGIVLMDSWYLSEELVGFLAQKGLDWVSLLKKNRNLETYSFTLRDETGQPLSLPGPHIKVEALVPRIPRSAYRQVHVSGRDYWCFALNLRIAGLGKVRLVISFDNPELTGTYAALVSNRGDWSAKEVLLTYLQRWPIETFYQDSKGHLGLDEYRMRSAEAIAKHWCLVYVAYSLLHLTCLPASPRKGKGGFPSSPLQTIGEACRGQAQAALEAVILFAHDRLRSGQPAAAVFARLFTKQQAVRAVA